MSVELFLGIAGTVIALGVAITTIWQGFLTRKHYKLTVRPMLRIDWGFVLEKKIKIVLKNTGVGPAIISSVNFVIDDKPITQQSKQLADTVMHNLGQFATRYKFYELHPNESFYSGEERAIIESEQKFKNERELKKIIKEFDRLLIEVRYKSIYEESFKIKSSRQKFST